MLRKTDKNAKKDMENGHDHCLRQTNQKTQEIQEKHVTYQSATKSNGQAGSENSQNDDQTLDDDMDIVPDTQSVFNLLIPDLQSKRLSYDDMELLDKSGLELENLLDAFSPLFNKEQKLLFEQLKKPSKSKLASIACVLNKLLQILKKPVIAIPVASTVVILFVYIKTQKDIIDTQYYNYTVPIQTVDKIETIKKNDPNHERKKIFALILRAIGYATKTNRAMATTEYTNILLKICSYNHDLVNKEIDNISNLKFSTEKANAIPIVTKDILKCYK